MLVQQIVVIESKWESGFTLCMRDTPELAKATATQWLESQAYHDRDVEIRMYTHATEAVLPLGVGRLLPALPVCYEVIQRASWSES
jgi:hypothetical protein